jgi:hypothetical protein
LKLSGICYKGSYRSIPLPCYPASDTSIDWSSDEDTGEFEEDTDYFLLGESTLTPEILLKKSTVLPSDLDDTPYPYTVNFTVGPHEDSEFYLLVIFQLAAYYYRNPEALDERKPDVGSIFWANIDLLSNHFL